MSVVRARSTPPPGSSYGDDAEVNPFWTQKVRDEMALRQGRPEGLPAADGASVPIKDGGWSRESSRGRSLVPKSWKEPIPGLRTQGEIPAEEEMRTEGRVIGAKDDLERELEDQLMRDVMQQNDDLASEVDRLRMVIDGLSRGESQQGSHAECGQSSLGGSRPSGECHQELHAGDQGREQKKVGGLGLPAVPRVPGSLLAGMDGAAHGLPHRESKELSGELPDQEDAGLRTPGRTQQFFTPSEDKHTPGRTKVPRGPPPDGESDESWFQVLPQGATHDAGVLPVLPPWPPAVSEEGPGREEKFLPQSATQSAGDVSVPPPWPPAVSEEGPGREEKRMSVSHQGCEVRGLPHPPGVGQQGFLSTMQGVREFLGLRPGVPQGEGRGVMVTRPPGFGVGALQDGVSQGDLQALGVLQGGVSHGEVLGVGQGARQVEASPCFGQGARQVEASQCFGQGARQVAASQSLGLGARQVEASQFHGLGARHGGVLHGLHEMGDLQGGVSHGEGRGSGALQGEVAQCDVHGVGVLQRGAPHGDVRMVESLHGGVPQREVQGGCVPLMDGGLHSEAVHRSSDGRGFHTDGGHGMDWHTGVGLAGLQGEGKAYGISGGLRSSSPSVVSFGGGVGRMDNVPLEAPHGQGVAGDLAAENERLRQLLHEVNMGQRYSGYWSTPVGVERSSSPRPPSPPPRPPSSTGTMPAMEFGELRDGGGGSGAKVELPVLKADGDPLALGDWLAEVEPYMRDLTGVASEWWTVVVGEANKLYAKWRQSSPMDRIEIQAVLPDVLKQQRFVRTEQRGAALLLKSVPEELRGVLITSRELCSINILYRLLVQYQPGGAGERGTLLKKLTVIEYMKGPPEVAMKVRAWRRWFARTKEIGATLPDPTLLLQALQQANQCLASVDAQAAFRLAQARANLQLDGAPCEDAVFRYSQMIVAEAETLYLQGHTGEKVAKVKALGKGSPVASSPVKTTSSPGKGGQGKEGSSPGSTLTCRFFLEGRCKHGDRCKQFHVKEKGRCWSCGSTDHMRLKCPVAQEQDDQESKGSKGFKGGGKSSYKGNGGANKTSVAALQSSPGTSAVPTGGVAGGAGVENSSTSNQASPGKSTDGGGSGGTLTMANGAVETLLKSMKLPGDGPAKVRMVKHEPTLESFKVASVAGLASHTGSQQLGLVDGGATHALRRAESIEEWEKAEETEVSLAEGTTKSLRLKVGTLTLLSDPHLPEEALIVPMGPLTLVGWKVEWSNGRCTLRHPRHESPEVLMKDGCPMVSASWANFMIKELDEHFKAVLRKRVALLTKGEYQTSQKDTVEMLMMKMLKQMAPDVPENILLQAIPEKIEVDETALPWNRRRRRQIKSAGRILLHLLFAGPDEKEWRKLERGDLVVLCVDPLIHQGQDLLDPNLFSFLLQLAADGKICAVIGGPPCRSVSPCRHIQPGPKQVRSREHPYGLPGLGPLEQALVDGDVVLWLRMACIYLVAKQTRKMAFAMEQPRDPEEYREPVEGGWASLWATDAWERFRTFNDLFTVTFDQGVCGHPRRKPTTMGTNLQGLRRLHGLKYWSQEKDSGGEDSWLDLPLEDRMAATKSWAAWAPGLKSALKDALEKFFAMQETKNIAKVSGGSLESWKRHYLNDHMPGRRDCQTCVAAAGRSRPHKRVTHPSAYTLAVDLSGRMDIGYDQHRSRAKYMVVGVYTFPVDRNGRSLVEMEADLDKPLPGDLHAGDLEVQDAASGEAAASGEDDDLVADLQQAIAEVGPGEDAAPMDVERPDEVDYDALFVDDGADPEVPCGVISDEMLAQSEAKWQKLIEESKEVYVKNVTMVECVPSRQSKDVLAALAKMYAKLRSLNMPVLRMHCDRARELIGKDVKKWCQDRDILMTCTSGSSFKENGRAESEINLVKQGVRRVLKETGTSVKYWPLAARHVGERRCRQQLEALGIPTAPLLPFGTRGFAFRKSWQGRYQDWRMVREEVIVSGPDCSRSFYSGGHYVQSVADKFFYYSSDVVLTSDFAEAFPKLEGPGIGGVEGAEAVAIEVEDENGGAHTVWVDPANLEPPLVGGGPVAHDKPRKRIHGKQAQPQVPVLSRMFLEGEDYAGGKSGCIQQTFGPDYIMDMVSDPLGSQREDPWDFSFLTEDGIDHGGAEAVKIRRLEERQNKEHYESLHNNLSEYILEEMEKLDIGDATAQAILPVVTEAIQAKNGLEMKLRRLAAEEEKVVQEQFLMTKVVGTEEVMSEIREWIPALKDELDSLTGSGSIKRVRRSQLEELAQGRPIEVLPSKMAFTRKAPLGKRRSRAVCCGNYEDRSASTEATVAGGADGIQIRTLLRAGAVRGWQAATTDVKAAFLNAPRRNQNKVLLMAVPKVYRASGLVEHPDEVWLIQGAVYGLASSPRDWSEHRDKVIEKLTWKRDTAMGAVVGGFERTSEDNLWKMVEYGSNAEGGESHLTPEGWFGEIKGYLSVYVDDLLFVGEEAVIHSAMESLTGTWQCSPLEFAGEKAMRYCGFEVQKLDGGFRLSQENFTKELLEKWGMNEDSSKSSTITSPNFVLPDPEAPEENPKDPAKVKEAQQLAGALLWLNTRTRPDLSVGVAYMSRAISRRPSHACEVGRNLLKYLKENPKALHYSSKVEKVDFGSREQLPVQRHPRLLEIHSDISYATLEGYKSGQGLVAFFAGAPVAWNAGRQPFVCQSTAESELVGLCEGLVMGKSMSALVDILTAGMDEDPKGINGEQLPRCVLYGDNMASIALTEGQGGSWRTRHLRIRAALLREALSLHSWNLIHLKGSELTADGFTKPLHGEAFERFCSDLGLNGFSGESAAALRKLKGLLGRDRGEAPHHEAEDRADHEEEVDPENPYEGWFGRTLYCKLLWGCSQEHWDWIMSAIKVFLLSFVIYHAGEQAYAVYLAESMGFILHTWVKNRQEDLRLQKAVESDRIAEPRCVEGLSRVVGSVLEDLASFDFGSGERTQGPQELTQQER